MGDPLRASSNGLIEQICQELSVGTGSANEPAGPSIDAQRGHWCLQFNDGERDQHIRMVVDVLISVPISVNLQFTSVMDRAQVVKLKDWLERMLNLPDG